MYFFPDFRTASVMRHGYGAGAVLARLQNAHGLLFMERDGRDEMHGVYGIIC